MMRPLLKQIVTGWLLFTCTAASREESPVVVDQHPPQVQTKYFNPADPPKEMPALKHNEAAVTQSQFGIGSAMEVTIIQQHWDDAQERVTSRVDKIKVTLDLKIIIWLPENANDKLTAHEEGHRRVSELFYRDAQEKARILAREWVGKELQGKGKDVKSAANAAMEKAMSQINQRYMATVSAPSSQAQEK